MFRTEANSSMNFLKKNSLCRIKSAISIIYSKFSDHKKIIPFALCFFILSLPLFTSSSFAALVFPTKLTDKTGSSSSQSLDVLTVQDQQGTEDVWSKYIEFSGKARKGHKSKRGYRGIFQFNLPPDFNPATTPVVLRANYRGQTTYFQQWKFQLLDVKTGRWTTITDNTNAIDWTWSNIEADINEIENFVNSRNQITLRYIANNNYDNSQLDFLALETNDTEPTPDTSATPRWQPVPGMKWHIQYEGTLNSSLNVDIFNIDLFDTSAATISNLRSNGKHVICYLSTGSYESWRPDAKDFPAAVLGRNLNGWRGEKWLDVRRLDVLIPIMSARMKLAVKKGCQAVDPDNVDGYTNKTGFPLTYNDQLTYNKALAAVAHKLGLAIGLKNDLDQVKDLVNHYDFAVNEECFAYSECNLLKPFINAKKPVYGIEYNLPISSFCHKANTMGFDFQKKNLSLDAWVEACQ